jgi:hypothetical protein
MNPSRHRYFSSMPGRRYWWDCQCCRQYGQPRPPSEPMHPSEPMQGKIECVAARSTKPRRDTGGSQNFEATRMLDSDPCVAYFRYAPVTGGPKLHRHEFLSGSILALGAEAQVPPSGGWLSRATEATRTRQFALVILATSDSKISDAYVLSPFQLVFVILGRVPDLGTDACSQSTTPAPLPPPEALRLIALVAAASALSGTLCSAPPLRLRPQPPEMR